MKDNYILIIDYNLSRLKDVQIMFEYAKKAHNLSSILIRPNPTLTDRQLAGLVIDLDPLHPKFVEQSLIQLQELIPNIKIAIPFSDNAVVTGATLAKRLNVSYDCPESAMSAFSKIHYRAHEFQLREILNKKNIMLPRTKIISSLNDIIEFSNLVDAFVIKPSCEGNNRGVIKLNKTSDFESAFDEIKTYIHSGVLCEELIPFDEEYSFDGIGHLSFITEKLSKKSRYPVEYGQIVPALGSNTKRIAISQSGQIANQICGQKYGPFHNEIKYDRYTHETAVVEPNRRPAGMKIWHLAERVFGCNFFHMWIDQMISGQLPDALPKPRGRAALYKLPVPATGIFDTNTSINDLEMKFLNRVKQIFRKYNGTSDVMLHWFDFSIQCMPGDHLNCDVVDNSGFMAEICVHSEYDQMNFEPIFALLEDIWRDFIHSYIVSNSNNQSKMSHQNSGREGRGYEAIGTA